MGEFDGKVVIVTGGAMGIGAGAAVEFGRQGASVAIADINASAAQETADRIQDAGGKAIVAEAVSAFGGVDVLFNNVGIQPPESYTNVEDASEEMWDRIIGVNLKSRFLMAKYVIPEMRKRRGGGSS